MSKSFLTLDKKMFNDVIYLIYCKCIKANIDGLYISGAVLNCIFCFFSIEKKQKIKKEIEKIYNKISEQTIIDNRNHTCKIRTPIICDNNQKEFVFTCKSDVYDSYLPYCLTAVDYHDDYAYYQVCNITSPGKEKYSELPLQEKRGISKQAISRIDKTDIVAEFYINLFKILQLHPDRICDYIMCIEMLFFVLDNKNSCSDNISNEIKDKAFEIINTRKINVYENNENEYFIYNIFIQTMNKLEQEFIFEIDKFSSQKHL